MKESMNSVPSQTDTKTMSGGYIPDGDYGGSVKETRLPSKGAPRKTSKK